MKMANTQIEYQELRIDVRDPEVTHVYVLIANLSRDGFPIGGWYHKAFPARMSMLDIMQAWARGEENPIMWPQQVPLSSLAAEGGLGDNYGDAKPS